MEKTHSPRTVLVTGGAGFIGKNFVHYVLDKYPDVKVVNVDCLTYAGTLSGCPEELAGRYCFARSDIRDRERINQIFADFQPDTVVHFAAESHVDRSIDNPLSFVETNVLGTAVLLDAALRLWKDRKDVRFHHISTDEVFGSLADTGYFDENTPYDPSSPYSASKAGSDHLVRAWHRTFGLPVTLSNCSNNYGPWQFPEKLAPLIIQRALNGKELPVYGDGKNVRDWLYVEDHCDAIWRIVTQGQVGECYTVGGNCECANIDFVTRICDIIDRVKPRPSGSSRDQIVFVKDRPGHDLRYAIDASRIAKELGWQPAHSLDDGLEQTIRWYLDHQGWLDEIAREKYDGGRLGNA